MDRNSLGRTLVPVLILAVYVLAIWFVLLPAWKRELIQARLAAMANPRPIVQHLLSAADEMQVRQFRNLISRWDHEQSSARHHTEESN